MKVWIVLTILMMLIVPFADASSRFMENLDRGMVAVRSGTSNYIGWRMLGTDPADISFHIYRNSTKITGSPITHSTNYLDSGGTLGSTYRIAPVIGGIEQELSDAVVVWSNIYHDIPLQVPAGGTTPDDVIYTYSPNDCSVGDLDGDGQYEIILKWDPSNSKDNAHSGYTGNVYLDAYEMDGTFLWRIDLGINIRAGAHYTQFMVYDFDSDGTAEIACKTADGTVDGMGTVIGDPLADYRNGDGYILDGPEYFTVFDGATGAALDTEDYIVSRGNVSDWGDSTGNRVDRFLACVAYLDGVDPSIVMCRGYYTRAVLAAWDFKDGKLSRRWVFDSRNGYPAYEGQGNHNLSVADVDGDGKDEIIYGACAIDDDGSGLYSTGLGHGDAMHVSDMDPSRQGLEVWQPHEGSATGATFRDAATGEILIDHYNAGDVGRGCAAHIDSRYFGYQLWSYALPGVYTVDNVQISANYPNLNFLVWWTADLQRELLDAADGQGKNTILNKWGGDGAYRLLSLYNIPTSYSTNSINGTKANPCLSADILGDWREELILRSSDNTKLRIFTTTDVTSTRMYTLLHDPQYRLAVAWQNVAYNQPPHPSFYIGQGMSSPPAPDILLVGKGDPADDAPPTPDPMGWAAKPYSSGKDSIAMEAAAASDPSGVEYYFTCTSGGGHDSGWQRRPYYEDTGLIEGNRYTYTVKARDRSGNMNTTLASVPVPAVPDGTAVAYWRFEEGPDGAAVTHNGVGDGVYDEGTADSSGNGYGLSVWALDWAGYAYTADVGLAQVPQTGAVNRYSVRNTGDFPVLYTDSTDAINGITPSAFTIEASFKLEHGNYRTIVGRDSYGTNTANAALSALYFQAMPSNALAIKYCDVSGYWHEAISATGVFTSYDGASNPDGTGIPWYSMAAVSDGATLSLYLKNLTAGTGWTLIAQTDMTAGGSPNTALTAGAGSGTDWTAGDWSVGRGLYDGNHEDRAYGFIDEVRICDSALAVGQFLNTETLPIPWLYGDFTGNHTVDYDDFAVFTHLWLREDCLALAAFDADEDCVIGLPEFALMANHWLLIE